MNLLVSSNDNYKIPTMVMLTSFFDANPPAVPAEAGAASVPAGAAEAGGTGMAEDVPAEAGAAGHTVYMLESSLSAGAEEEIRGLIRRRGSRYVGIHIPEDLFSGAKTKPYISRETYYRLLAAKYLPAEEERVLWLDSDILVRKDLRGFYGTEFGESMAAACGYGPAMRDLILDNARALGLAHPEGYFNAGVMLMNLRAMRNTVDEGMLAELAAGERTQTFRFPGQDVVNLVFDGRAKLADYRIYNCMIHSIEGPEDLEEARRNAAVIHYAGEAKPWKFSDIHFADEWMDKYRECFGDSAELKRMSYFRLKALFSRGRQQDSGSGHGGQR